MRSEKEKNAISRTDKYKMATPIPFYLIDGFRRYECKDDIGQINIQLSTKENIDKLMKVYTSTCAMYAQQFTQQNNIDYIKMIKLNIDYAMFKTYHDNLVLAFL